MVKELKIQPSEFWKMRVRDALYLMKDMQAKDIDISVMLNYQREINGADREWLMKD